MKYICKKTILITLGLGSLTAAHSQVFPGNQVENTVNPSPFKSRDPNQIPNDGPYLNGALNAMIVGGLAAY